MSDLISRQAAITEIQQAYADTEGGDDKCAVWKNVGLTTALHIMQDLPSAQSNVHDFPKDADCISRAAAIRVASGFCHPANVAEELAKLPSARPHLDEWCTDCKEYNKEKHCCPRWNRVIRQTLKDAQEHKPGRWIDIDSESYTWKIRCNQCGHERSMMSTHARYPKFCEECGAKMGVEHAEI